MSKKDICILFVLVFAAVFAITVVIKCDTDTQRVGNDMWQKPIEVCKVNGGVDYFDISGDTVRNVIATCQNGATFKYLVK